MVIDFIIVAILVISILIGIKIGLIKSLINLAAIFLSIIIAMTLCKPVASLLMKNTQMDEAIQSTIVKTILGEDKTKEKQEDKSKNDIQKYIEQAGETIDNAKRGMVTQTAQELTKQIMIGISFIGLYLLSSVIIFVIKQISNLLTSLPVIKQFDKIGGGIIGAINAIIIVYIALGIVKVVGVTVKNPTLIKEVNNSIITKIIFDKNPVESIITSISKK